MSNLRHSPSTPCRGYEGQAGNFVIPGKDPESMVQVLRNGLFIHSIHAKYQYAHKYDIHVNIQVSSEGNLPSALFVLSACLSQSRRRRDDKNRVQLNWF
jgi:hypothetical protein